MTDNVILDSLSSQQTQDVIRMAAENATTGKKLVELLRSPYGHYGSILDAAANYIEKLETAEPRA